jgi:hypothetical protein
MRLKMLTEGKISLGQAIAKSKEFFNEEKLERDQKFVQELKKQNSFNFRGNSRQGQFNRNQNKMYQNGQQSKIVNNQQQRGRRFIKEEDRCEKPGHEYHTKQECFEFVNQERRKQNACLSCGSKDHFQANCPKNSYKVRVLENQEYEHEYEEENFEEEENDNDDSSKN